MQMKIMLSFVSCGSFRRIWGGWGAWEGRCLAPCGVGGHPSGCPAPREAEGLGDHWGGREMAAFPCNIWLNGGSASFLSFSPSVPSLLHSMPPHPDLPHLGSLPLSLSRAKCIKAAALSFLFHSLTHLSFPFYQIFCVFFVAGFLQHKQGTA